MMENQCLVYSLPFYRVSFNALNIFLWSIFKEPPILYLQTFWAFRNWRFRLGRQNRHFRNVQTTSETLVSFLLLFWYVKRNTIKILFALKKLLAQRKYGYINNSVLHHNNHENNFSVNNVNIGGTIT